MRHFLLLVMLVNLCGCGIVKRFIPRPSPRVILTGGKLASLTPSPCCLEDADLEMAAYYAYATPAPLPS